MKIETVEVNGVIVNVGEEETAAKFAKTAKPTPKDVETKDVEGTKDKAK